jgi:hypothetical protein
MQDDEAIYYYKNGDRLFVRYVKGKKEGKGKVIYYGGVERAPFFLKTTKRNRLRCNQFGISNYLFRFLEVPLLYLLLK